MTIPAAKGVASHPGGTRPAEFARIEQRTLALSMAAVAGVALLSLAWGLAIESDAVILNGVFSLVSLVGSGLYYAAARLVTRPADRRSSTGMPRSSRW
jgi:predicted Co/Zn/Cd cation transporter (cation efflux family)